MRLPTFASLSEGLRATILRFPIPTIFAAITTGLLVFSIHDGFDDSHLARFAFLTGLGFVASLLCDLIAEARSGSERNRLLGHVSIVVLLILYSSFIMPELLGDGRPPFWYGYFILLFALHLGIALVPAFANTGPEKLWRFNLSCFLRYFFSSVNSAILFGGLALALVSIDKLFELRLEEELYPQLWLICAFFAHPMLFMSGLPRLEQLNDDRDFPKPLRFSLCFIGLPLVALYLVILYAYMAKIGIQWAWPNGWVAMPIFVLAVISLLTFALSLPLPKSENWARFYHRWLFRLLLPLSIILFMALQVRLGDYGMTINRYLGLALAIWLFGISLAYIIRPRLRIGWMPFSLLVVALFSIYAGPLGAFGWSERAQVERTRELGAELNVLHDGVLTPTETEQDGELVREFRSSLKYVLENYGRGPFETELSGFYASDMGSEIDSARAHYLSGRILDYLELDDDVHYASKQFNYSKNVLSTFGHDWKVEYYYYTRNHNRSFDTDYGKLTLRELKDEKAISCELDGVELSKIDISNWPTEVSAAIEANGLSQPEPLAWHTEGNGWSFSFVMTNAYVDKDDDVIRNATLSVFYSAPEDD